MLTGHDARIALGVALILAVLAVLAAVVILWARRGRGFGTVADEATYSTLHTAGLAAPHLRDGLTPEGTQRAARHLRRLLHVPAMAITDPGSVLVWDGLSPHHRHQALAHASDVLHSGRVDVVRGSQVRCGDENCPIKVAVVAPIVVEDQVVGALAAYGSDASVGLVRATTEVASWVSMNVTLAELGWHRTRTMEAELRALRAQISPHFVYNSLAAIASFVRTDPDRARELLLEFADFTRYSFRASGAFVPLADELTNIERYLTLEQARFGERLQVALDIDPDVLGTRVPYLAIQPLVENAVRHGLEPKVGVGHVTLTARSVGTTTEISVEDDGVGGDPERVRAILAGEHESDNVGLGNVDARLRQVYGDRYGLVVETAPDAGTKVTFHVPKADTAAPDA